MCAPCLKSEGSKVLKIRNIYGSLLTLDSADSWNILSNCIGGLNYGAFLVAEDSKGVLVASKLVSPYFAFHDYWLRETQHFRNAKVIYSDIIYGSSSQGRRKLPSSPLSFRQEAIGKGDFFYPANPFLNFPQLFSHGKEPDPVSFHQHHPSFFSQSVEFTHF